MKVEYIVSALVVVLAGAGLAFLYLGPVPGQGSAVCEASSTCPPQNMDVPEQRGERYKEIVYPSGFVNTEPITLGEFIGKKVILLDFLTYSCINCQRTFPYLNAWDEHYRGQGLEIIGIHTPEFAFEKNIDNVREAMEKFGITHPVVLDNEYATWRAYGNNYWPRRYLIDIRGNIVYDHIGEGAYEETEQKIRELLAERARVLGETTQADGALATRAIVPTTFAANSPETYFGSARNELLGNGTSGKTGMQAFVLPETLRRDTLYLGGSWEMLPEYARNTKEEAHIAYRFDANNVYFVAGAAAPIDVTVLVDGKETKRLTVRANTLYTLVENVAAGTHTLELIIHSPGLEAYTFTFG